MGPGLPLYEGDGHKYRYPDPLWPQQVHLLSIQIPHREGLLYALGDLVEMFMSLADKYGMDYWFGTYMIQDEAGKKDFARIADYNLYVIDEVWERYSHHKSFKGWYLSTEIKRQLPGCIESFCRIGKHCKEISGGFPTFISPFNEREESLSCRRERRRYNHPA